MDAASPTLLGIVGLVITPSPVVIAATATKSPAPEVTPFHGLSAALVLIVQVIPSGEVITRLPVPETATATKRPFAHVIPVQALSAALAAMVQVAPPSALHMALLPAPSMETA